MRLRAKPSRRAAALAALTAGALIVAILTSCADATAPTTDTVIGGPAGGAFAFLDGAVLIVFPPNAVDADVEFSVTWAPDAPSAAQLVPGTAFEVIPSHTFPQNVDIRVRTSAFALPVGPSGVQLGRNETGPWELLATRVVSEAAGVIGAPTSTFSSFGLLVPVSHVALAPLADTFVVGDTVRFTATTLAADSTVLTDRSVTWISSAEPVATVSSSGLVTGLAAGIATIIATSEGKTGSATVAVMAAGT